MKVHHIGYLVDDINIAISKFEQLGYVRKTGLLTDSERQIYCIFLDNGGYVVELIEPISETSPVYGLRKKYRNSPYHICYETENLQSEIDKLTDIAGGYTIMQPPQQSPEIPGAPNVAFLMSSKIGIIELLQHSKK